MKLGESYLIVIIVFCANPFSVVGDRFLKLSTILMFQGASSPNCQYSNLNGKCKDMFSEEWSDSNKLTAMGMRQLFLLGKKFSKKFNKTSFLSKSYNISEISAYSQDDDISFMSLQAFFSGLYSVYSGPSILPSQVTSAVPPVQINDLDLEMKLLGLWSLPLKSQIFSTNVLKDKDVKIYEPMYCNRVEQTIDENKIEMNVTSRKYEIFDKYSIKLSKAFNFLNPSLEVSLKTFEDLAKDYEKMRFENRTNADVFFRKEGIDITLLSEDIERFKMINYESIFGKQVKFGYNDYLITVLSLLNI